MVKASMQEKFNSDPEFVDLHLSVEYVRALKEGDNRYQAIATVRHEGDAHEVPVHVTANGDSVIWKTDQGAFLVVRQKALRKALEKVGAAVRASMQQKFSTDPEFKGFQLVVEHVQVLQEGENRYQAIARIRHEGDLHEVPVHVTADGDNVIWRTDPGTFLFVVPKAIRRAMQQPTRRTQ